MSDILIGGHLGMEVWQTEQGISKRASDEANTLGLRNEANILQLLASAMVAPKHLSEMIEDGHYSILQEPVAGENLRDAGDTRRTVVNDGEVLRRNAARFLRKLRQFRVRHGDLTAPNLFVCPGDTLIAVDWQQSHLFSQLVPEKYSDSFLLWRTLSTLPAVVHPTPDTPRVIRRWMAVMEDLGGKFGSTNLEGKTLLDLGCFQGDFCAMAQADGMEAKGIDLGGFQSGVDSIAVAKELWPDVEFEKKNVLDVPDSELSSYDAVLLFSVWSYVLNDYGENAASDLISRIVRNAGALYFENQLLGDGPGPAMFRTDEDVYIFLRQFGQVKNLVSIPVTGREAMRSVFKVTHV